MNTEVKTKVVLASVLAGVSTLANANPAKAMSAEIPGVSAVRQEVVVSQAALKAIDANVQQAALRRGRAQAAFYQIIRGPFVESGPDFVQAWKGQMRLP
ncbi:MAG: hypothetical protein QOJ99_430 [Bryobacterales bacterium]|jgi:hypothetical protein|nr:hypothetical protein [Bryobacterales bacterium]